MGIKSKFHKKVIGVDTAPFIYYMEENPRYVKIVDEFFKQNDAGQFLISTSTITLLEVSVIPNKENNASLVESYENILENSKGIELIDISPSIVKIAAKLRARYNLRTPDAIQIATALYSDAEYFVTNDFRLKMIEEIEVILIDDLVAILNI